jgi:hypothetical protein
MMLLGGLDRAEQRYGMGREGRPVIDSAKWTLDTTMDLAQTGRNKEPKPPRAKARGSLEKTYPRRHKINVDASFRDMEMQGATHVWLLWFTGQRRSLMVHPCC